MGDFGKARRSGRGREQRGSGSEKQRLLVPGIIILPATRLQLHRSSVSLHCKTSVLPAYNLGEADSVVVAYANTGRGIVL